MKGSFKDSPWISEVLVRWSGLGFRDEGLRILGLEHSGFRAHPIKLCWVVNEVCESL